MDRWRDAPRMWGWFPMDRWRDAPRMWGWMKRWNSWQGRCGGSLPQPIQGPIPGAALAQRHQRAGRGLPC
eukprot:7258141-Alexandrium_andersonii.AAC.1